MVSFYRTCEVGLGEMCTGLLHLEQGFSSAHHACSIQSPKPRLGSRTAAADAHFPSSSLHFPAPKTGPSTSPALARETPLSCPQHEPTRIRLTWSNRPNGIESQGPPQKGQDEEERLLVGPDFFTGGFISTPRPTAGDGVDRRSLQGLRPKTVR